ncbi:MAG TPA: nucleotidyltransferase, partial [Candidatus Dormibacteraeota bacterium]
MWFFVTRRFTRLLAELTITDWQREDGQTKQAGVRLCLNRYYWGVGSETANSMLIGSWGKNTRLRPPRDVDILFLLPATVHARFQERDGNRQSQLLQEVKEVLAQTYTQTTMRGDGQVVLIPFNSTPVEVAPGFRCRDGSI